MDQAWKSINRFIVSFTSNFDKWKIKFYTEFTDRGPVDRDDNFLF